MQGLNNVVEFELDLTQVLLQFALSVFVQAQCVLTWKHRLSSTVLPAKCRVNCLASIMVSTARVNYGYAPKVTVFNCSIRQAVEE